MTRELRPVSAADPLDVLAALRRSLTADGPAVLPYAAREPRTAPQTTPHTVPHTVPQRIALVVETSGSVSTPKRVAFTADALLASATAAESALGGPGQWLLALPAHYIAGINVLVRSLASQTDPVILPGGHFDPIEFAEAATMMDAPLRFTSLVPTQLARLIEADATLEALRRFDRILVGGQAMPLTLQASALELGLNITRTYGSSETGGGCVYDGIPIGDTRLRIVDGQLEIAGSVLADGYLGDDERTTAAFHVEDGIRWYRTQDTGEIVDGTLHVTGRIDDVIVSGGINVSVAAVERVVQGLPGLADAVVISAPSVEWGQVPVIVAVRDVQLSAVQQAVAHILGPAARPVKVITVDALPLLSSGKVDRQALRALAAGAAST